MSIGIRVGSIITEVGTPSFFNAFFSTVSGLLEPLGQGSRFPIVANDFYQGTAHANDLGDALRELAEIKSLLASYPPSAVIWDLEDPSLRPPWGDQISPEITSMANYFVTSTGRDLFTVIDEVFQFAHKRGLDVTIE